MVGVIRRLAIAGAAAFVPVAFVTVVCPGVSNAAECGFGSIRSADQHLCGGTTSTATATSAAPAASLERRSHAVLLGRYLRAHSVRVAVHRHLSRPLGLATGPTASDLLL